MRMSYRFLATLLLAVPAWATAAQSGGLLLFPTYRHRDDPSLAANPHLVGSLITVYWSEVEQIEGRFDWSVVERRAAVWTAAGKKFALRVMWSSSGHWPDPAAQRPTPRWVFEKGAAKVVAERSNTDVALEWDPVYRKYAARFLAELARKFDGDPDCLFVDVTPGAETNPYRMRTISRLEPEFEQRFREAKSSDGRKYSDELWLETVRSRIAEAAKNFRETRLLITLNRGSLGGPSQMREIGDFSVGLGLMVGQNGLTKRSGEGLRSPFVHWSSQSPVYMEMLDATDSGNTGTLMEVMLAAERVGSHFVAVYASDVIKGTPGQPGFDPERERALRFGAEMLARRAPQ